MIAVLLVTHGPVGENLVDTVANMWGELALKTDIIEVARDDDPDERIAATQQAAAALDQGDGVLVLTDAFGSTPSNVANNAAQSVANQSNCRVVAGVNLPMLVRIYNYPKLGLEDMVASAVEAGRQGVMSCTSPQPPQKKNHA